MNKSNFYLYQKKLFEACHKIAIKKGNDYARGDDPFANFRTAEAIGVKPIKGILIRIMDKIQRLNNYGVVGSLITKAQRTRLWILSTTLALSVV